MYNAYKDVNIKIKLQYVNFAFSYKVTHINKTIIINYNTSRATELTKGGHKLSTCLKH